MDENYPEDTGWALKPWAPRFAKKKTAKAVSKKKAKIRCMRFFRDLNYGKFHVLVVVVLVVIVSNNHVQNCSNIHHLPGKSFGSKRVSQKTKEQGALVCPSLLAVLLVGRGGGLTEIGFFLLGNFLRFDST